MVWRIRSNATKLVCAVGSRNGTEETKLLVLDFGTELGTPRALEEEEGEAEGERTEEQGEVGEEAGEGSSQGEIAAAAAEQQQAPSEAMQVAEQQC